MQKLRNEMGGLMTRLGGPNVLVFSCIFGWVILTESLRWLDLIPIILLIPWTMVFGVLVVLFAMVAFLFAWLHWRGSRFRYSTRTILLLGFMAAWPVSRFTVDARVERRRIQAQQQCFEMVIALTPPAKQVLMSGRYNDGQADYAIQRWLIGLIALGLDANKIRFEIGDIASMDLSDSAIDDAQLGLVAKTQTVSELNLTSTNITDAGLEQFYELRSLRFLTLTNTTVSKPAIEALKMRLPNLSVEQ